MVSRRGFLSGALAAALTGGCALLRPTPPRPPGLAATLRGHWHSVTSLAVTPDGRTLVSGGRDGRVRLWETATDTQRASLTGGLFRRAVWTVAVSPDGRLLASGADDLVVRLWDTPTGAARGILEGHTESLRVLGWSPDGRLLASGGRDTTVRLWDTDTWKAVAVLPHGNTVRGIAWARDSARLFTGCADDVIYAWAVPGGELLATLRGHRNAVQALAITPDGRTLVSGSADQTLRLWSVASTTTSNGVLVLDRRDGRPGALERYGIAPGPEIMAVATSPDGRVFASAHRDRAIHLWGLPSGRELTRLLSPAETTYAVVFSRDGRWLYSGGDDNRIHKWDITRVISVAR